MIHLEPVIFASFLLLAYSSHAVHDHFVKHFSHHPKLAMIGAHVTFWFAVKEYLIHFVIYSGYLLPKH